MCRPSQVEARKPEWAVGAQQPIKRKAKASGKAVAQSQPPSGAASKAATAWGAFASDGQAELIDDEELLTEADLARPDVPGIHVAMHAWLDTIVNRNSVCVRVASGMMLFDVTCTCATGNWKVLPRQHECSKHCYFRETWQ